MKRHIGLVGPCGSGKTSLSEALSRRGFHVTAIAQEHSFVPDMWQRLTKPQVLIYLEASYATTVARKGLPWSEQEYQEQLRRLAHARQHAHLILSTDGLTLEQTLRRVLDFLHQYESARRA